MKNIILSILALLLAIFCFRGWRMERKNFHLAFRDMLGTIAFGFAFLVFLGRGIKVVFFNDVDKTIINYSIDENRFYESDSQDKYTCSMHLDVVKEEPGECPICGLSLQIKELNSGDL